uniref:Putative homing endonuclease n=1 Tax=viral metagenome TaxID=1070528 RepID=A0A6M3LH54_9ZZZZ
MEHFELYIESPPKLMARKGTVKKNGIRKYLSNSEIKEIIKLYPDKFNWELARDFKVSESSINNVRRKHNLKKSDSIMDAKRFKKGQISHNKGKHYPLVNSGQFNKGHIPKNHKPVGSKRLTKDGYYEIKISEPNRWEAFHRMVWQDINGEIPEGMIVVFKDDKLNCDISNLEIISRKENLIRNLNRPKFSNTMKALWRIEKLRAEYGMKRKTNLRIS